LLTSNLHLLYEIKNAHFGGHFLDLHTYLQYNTLITIQGET